MIEVAFDRTLPENYFWCPTCKEGLRAFHAGPHSWLVCNACVTATYWGYYLASAAEHLIEPEITEEAKALADLAKQRYGKYLEDDEIAGLTEDLNYGVRAGERLRKAELTNADEPDFIYRAGF